jgi:hypothetical protein
VIPLSLSERLNVSPEEKAAAEDPETQHANCLPSTGPAPRSEVGLHSIPGYVPRSVRMAKARAAAPPSYSKMPRDVVAAASRRAGLLFHAFTSAPWRYNLGKCKRCYCYFVLKVKPSKTPYIRGMHCPACKSIASAGASAKARRVERELQLISLAAKVWSSWRPTPQFGERNEWVAKQVSSGL